MRASVMQLHSPFSASCSDSYSKMVKAAKEIIEIARELAVTCEAYWHLVVEVCLIVTLYTLKRLIRSRRLLDRMGQLD
jgi:hypothetical protein